MSTNSDCGKHLFPELGQQEPFIFPESHKQYSVLAQSEFPPQYKVPSGFCLGDVVLPGADVLPGAVVLPGDVVDPGDGVGVPWFLSIRMNAPAPIIPIRTITRIPIIIGLPDILFYFYSYVEKKISE